MVKRNVEVAVISDVHLGTFGCHAEELLKYLHTINPKTLILNGDIIDMWQFKKRYWPKSHMRVIKHILDMFNKQTQIYYVTGNHDEIMRKFAGFGFGNFKIVNKVLLTLDGKKAWFFHGDVFDITMEHSKWLVKLGAIGYDILILLNAFVNFISEKVLGRGKISLSQKIKNSVKSAVKYINNFEQTAAEIAISNKFDHVVCGHIHQPEIRDISNHEGTTSYLNSGDWIENLTSLEYNDGKWSIYYYREDPLAESVELEEDSNISLNNTRLFENLVHEFESLKK